MNKQAPAHNRTRPFGQLLALFAGISGACCAETAPAQPITPPKAIILLYADDLGYGDLSCYGAEKIKTPAIDKLADEGLRFTDAYSSSAVCTPSRYALLTGTYPWRRKDVNILPGDAALLIDPAGPTLPKMLQANGYKTAVIGKWHLGLGNGKVDWNKPISPGPKECGFDESLIFAATADRVPCVYVQNGTVRNLDPKDPIQVSYQHNFPGLPSGKNNPELLRVKSSHGHNNAVINGIGRIGFMKGGKAALWDDQNIADDITEHAVDYIKRQAAAKQPFFLYFATNDIHVPRDPHKRYLGKSQCGIRGDAAVQMDDCVRRIMKALDETGLTEDSLVIFSSDNGPVMDDGYADRANEDANGHKPAGPLSGGKYSILEGGSRIPFIVHWPKAVRPGESTAVLCQMDLMATLGQLFPGEQEHPADSQKLLPALLGKTSQGRSEHILNSMGQNLAFRSGDWKYVPPGAPIRRGLNGLSPSDKAPATGALYNLKNDPQERNNVAEAHKDLCEQFRARLTELRQAPENRLSRTELFPIDD